MSASSCATFTKHRGAREEVSWDALRGGVDVGGAIVNPRMAENLSTVLACVNAIASSCRACRRMRKLESEFSRAASSARPRARRIAWSSTLAGLLRGDPAQRLQSWAIAVQNGILSPDEVREEQGWNLGAPRKSAPASAT
jgi:hypothetical protein